jgi:hypothetical protein
VWFLGFCKDRLLSIDRRGWIAVKRRGNGEEPYIEFSAETYLAGTGRQRGRDRLLPWPHASPYLAVLGAANSATAATDDGSPRSRAPRSNFVTTLSASFQKLSHH